VRFDMKQNWTESKITKDCVVTVKRFNSLSRGYGGGWREEEGDK